MTRNTATILVILLLLILTGSLIYLLLFMNEIVIDDTETKSLTLYNTSKKLRLIVDELGNDNRKLNLLYDDTLHEDEDFYESDDDELGGGNKVFSGCQKNSDCGNDRFVGSVFCERGDLYQKFYDYGCNRNKCERDIQKKIIKECSFGCYNGACIVPVKTQCEDNLDNDSDALVDKNDPGCWNDMSKPDTYNPKLNDESKGSVVCFESKDCGNDGFIGDKSCAGKDVMQNFKLFNCKNPGTGISECESKEYSKTVQSCGENQGCFGGNCLPIVCSTNNDCNDNKPITIDNCINPGTVESYCDYDPIVCNTNTDCNDNNAFTKDTCMNPGSKNSICKNEAIKCFTKSDCGTDGFSGNTFCSNDSAVSQNFVSFDCLNPGTPQSSCQSATEVKPVQTCGSNNKCSNGDCVPINCDSNDDCGFNDYFGVTYCQNGDVWQNFKEFNCSNPGSFSSGCRSLSYPKLVSRCEFGCKNGKCINEDCDNGIDDDGDGLIDDLMELNPDNNQVFSAGSENGKNSPFRLMNLLKTALLQKKFMFTSPTSALLLSDNGQGSGFVWTSIGSPHEKTVDKVCEIFGFATVKDYDCLDDERSGNYPNGKCNYHTPEDNELIRFNGNDFVAESAVPKYNKTWMSKIVCEDKLSACNDGWDNDNDGKIDLEDTGCASPDDDSEIPHDPECRLI